MSKCIHRLPNYDDFRGFDLSNEVDVSAIAKRVSAGFAKPSPPTLKHHLFNTHVPKKLFRSIRASDMGDKKDEFKKNRFGEWVKYTYRKLPMGWRKWIL